MSTQYKSKAYCCVPQCSTRYDGVVSFHKFPSYNTKLKSEWARVLKIGKDVTKYMVVCSKHFQDEDYFLNKAFINKNPRLKRNAVPSQNLPKGSHERKTNHELSTMRSNRLERRRQLKESQVYPEDKQHVMDQQTNNFTVEGSANQQRCMNSDIEVAEVLLSLGNTRIHNIQGEKTFEDKAVQVNTYEDFHLPDMEDLITTNYKLKVLTGIINFGLLNLIVSTISIGIGKTKLSVKKRVLLTLMRLKLDLTFAALGVLFNISATTAKTYFERTIQSVALVLKPVIRLPPKEEILNNMPRCFESFKQTLIILDCTEIQIERSKCLNCRIKSYSFYKGNHTVKFLIGTTPAGLISYISKPYGGRASDKAIFNQERLIEKLEPPGACMVDKGFLIEKECAENNIELIRPPFLRKKKQLTKAETQINVRIARARVHIERRIQRIKLFRVCRNTIPWSLLPLIKDIMHVICALTNLSQPILAPDKF